MASFPSLSYAQAQTQAQQPSPLQPVYENAPPTVAPTTSNYNVSPTAAVQQFQSADALSNQQASGNLANILASQGITGGDAITAENTLQGQLGASEAPSLASLITSAQGMGLGQSEFNAGAGNAASDQNLAALLGVNNTNVGAANASGTNLANLLMQNYGLDFGAFTNLLDAGLGGQQSLNTQGLGANESATGALGNAENAGTQQNIGDFFSALALLG